MLSHLLFRFSKKIAIMEENETETMWKHKDDKLTKIILEKR